MVTANPNPTGRTGTLTVGGWTVTVAQAGANEVLFEDDMESGTNGWFAYSPWALTTASSRSGTRAWTDSPGGHYQNDLDSNLFLPVTDLTGVSAATLTFWHRFDFGSGDMGSVWVQLENKTWRHLMAFTGTSPSWERVSLDLSPFVGQSIRLIFSLQSNASETADGWYIDDVAVYSTDFETAEPPPPPQATLENPAPESFQSGIGVISGWACNATMIEIKFNDGPPQEAAYGTSRGDTQSTCGDTDNGFGLLFNWNLLGDGIHTVQALADGAEFASVTVIVTTLGEEFLHGASGTLPLADFPDAGASRTLRWQQSQQNFVLTDGSPGRGGGTSGAPPHVLENPVPGSFQSGIGLISGWVCDAQTITIRFDDGPPQEAAYGTSRGDTQGACGDTDNGFGLPFNWNLLDDGLHTVTASADGVEFARVEVTVTTLGTEFRRGLSREVTLPDFPEVGTDVTLMWQEAQQNFVITTALPTQRLVDVNPVVTLPAGIQIPNVAVRSFYAETAEVLASPKPSLLLAEDGDGTVLLGVANRDGGLLGEGPGSVAVSVDSTAVVLVSLAAGYPVHTIDQSMVDAIRAHPSYQDLIAAMSTQIATDKNFLDRLLDYPEIVSQIEAVAAALSRGHAPQSLRAARYTTRTTASLPAYAAAAVQTQTAAAESQEDCPTRLRAMGKSLMLDLAALFVPVEATKQAFDAVASARIIPQRYKDCVAEREPPPFDSDDYIKILDKDTDDAIDLFKSAFLGPALRYIGRVAGCAVEEATDYPKRVGGAVYDAALANIGFLFERPGLTARGWLGAVIGDWHKENFEEARQHYQRLSEVVADGACSGEEPTGDQATSACQACLSKGPDWFYVICLLRGTRRPSACVKGQKGVDALVTESEGRAAECGIGTTILNQEWAGVVDTRSYCEISLR